MDTDSKRVIIGRICAVSGIKGWVKVHSHTQPRENILNYAPWLLCRNGVWQPIRVLDGRMQGKGLVVKLENCADRDAAYEWSGADVAIYRSQLPAPQPGSYYWADLIGLTVVNLQGKSLGVVDSLLETGANDVLVVKGESECLVPYIKDQVIKEVDLRAGTMRVDWDPDF